MVTREPSFTFGIEEEFHLVDRRTRDLAVAPRTLLAELDQHIGSQVSTEFLRSQIEIGTKPLSCFKEARRELSQQYPLLL
jgi:carboxylate-amine ligase